MRKLFVTGSTGFIGSHFVHEAVKRGFDCRCLVRSTSKLNLLTADGVELIEGTIDEPSTYQDAVMGVDTVINFAGITSSLDPRNLFHVNSSSCETLADACLHSSPPPRLVHISSVAAAGPCPAGATLHTESVMPAPVSLYGKSKRQGELFLSSRADDLPTTIVRPGIVYGQRDLVFAELIRPIYRWRLHVVAGFRTPPLSLIYVDDLVDLILKIVENGETLTSDPLSPQGYYFACDDSEFPNYWELGQRIAKAMNRGVFVWPLWRWVARCVAVAAQTTARMRGRSSMLTVDKVREAVVHSWACSCQKARDHFGFMPSKSLDERLPETVRWYVDNGWI